jgi:sigma-B regulation protein RsbU (phosphoserine phosphatase)
MKKILVVDDMPFNRELLLSYLQPEGYDLLEAESVKEAREIIETKKPDLILLDVLMPEIDGFSFCKELKLATKDLFLPVILVTALNDRESRLQGLECGADDFLSKPVDRLELLIKVRNMLKIRELNANLVSEMIFAGQVQKNLFLANNELGPNDYLHYQPCCRVGGDFLEVWEEAGARWALLADASGHGPSAALIAAASKALIERNSVGPSELLRKLNNKLCNLLEPSEVAYYVTAICLKIESNQVTFANAGHPPAFLKIGSGIKSLASQAIPLGIRKTINYTEEKIDFTSPGLLLTFSDGLLEVLTEEEIKQLLANVQGAEEAYQRLADFLKENPAKDDVCFLSLSV